MRSALHQRDHALEVAGLGEEIEGLHGGEFVTGGEETLQVTHLRGRIARYVNDGAGAEGEELVQEGLVAALAGRVDDHGRVSRREIEPGENLRGVAGAKRGVGDAVGRGVL